MSIHSSLRGSSALVGERSVFTRVERLAILKKDGRFKEESSSVYGLPKVRTRFKLAGAKKAAKAAKGDAAAPAAGGGAAGGKPAAAAPKKDEKKK
jgi:small basic protein (TIGR04137 family)